MIMEVQSPNLLIKGFAETHAGQELLGWLHEQHRWLACCCKTPNAIMFTRQANGVYSLVNHSEHGLHAIGCPFHSEVKGSPRSGPTMDDLAGGDFKKAKYMLLREYPKNGVSEPTNSDSSSSSSAIPTLVRLVWQLWDDSFMTFFHPDSKNSLEALYYKLRISARKIRIGNGEFLSDNLYLGAGEHATMIEQLQAKHEAYSDRRAQALFLCLAKEVSIEGDAAQVIDINDNMVIIEDVSGKPMMVNKLDHHYKPLLFAAIYSFEHPDAEAPVPIKYLVQPIIHELYPLLMLNLEDRAVGCELISLIKDHYSGMTELKAWAKRPIYPSFDAVTGMELWPAFLVTKATDTSRRTTAIFYGQENEDIRFILERNFDNHIYIPTQEITSKEDLLLHIVKAL